MSSDTNPFKEAGRFIKDTVKDPKNILNHAGGFLSGNVGYLGDITGLRSGSGALQEAIDKGEKSRYNTLLNSVQTDTLIDEQSRAELLSLLQLQKNTPSAQKIFSAAQEGIEPKYKARRATQEMYKLMIDQPGSKQTRGADYSLLMSNATPGGRGR